MRQIIALFSGGLFGAGLYAAGTTDTNVVHGWMDVFGTWNLVLGVMFLGSFIIMVLAWRFAARMQTSLLGIRFPRKTTAPINARMVIGATLFGTGWGLSGMCPGPTLASLSFNGVAGLVYFVAMVIGLKAGAFDWSTLLASPMTQRVDAVNEGN